MESEIGMGQVMGGEGLSFLMLEAMGDEFPRRRGRAGRGDKQTTGGGTGITAASIAGASPYGQTREAASWQWR